MAEEFSNEIRETGTEQPGTEARQAWEEVGHQFEQLGKSLAMAFTALWESEETQQHVNSVRDGLESLVDEVSAAVSDAAARPESETVRTEAQKAAESARKATENVVEEARPQITSALKQINAELQRLIERLDAGQDAD
jgi:gas vesicle protein